MIRHFRFNMPRYQNLEILNEKVTYVFRLFVLFNFFSFSFFNFLTFLQQWLSFYWACFQFTNFWESIIVTGNFYHGVAKCSCRKFCWSFSIKFLNIFMYTSGSIEPIMLIWLSVERYFPPAELEYRWCQFWLKVMMPEVEQLPGFKPWRTWYKSVNYGISNYWSP